MMPEMRLAFTMPPNTRLAPTALQLDWQSFLTSVLQVAVGIKVDEWTEWDPDVTYTTVPGSGVAVAVGQVAIDRTSSNKLSHPIKRKPAAQALLTYHWYGQQFHLF